jgi:hypothetical protein
VEGIGGHIHIKIPEIALVLVYHEFGRNSLDPGLQGFHLPGYFIKDRVGAGCPKEQSQE